MLNKGGCVYILSSISRSTLYIGVSSDLKWRIVQHREKYYPKSFTARYDVNILVYFEIHDSIDAAITREKYLKGKSRAFKICLIEKNNPDWHDLSEEVMRW